MRRDKSKKTKINGVDRAAMSYSMPGSKFIPTGLKSTERCVMFVVHRKEFKHEGGRRQEV